MAVINDPRSRRRERMKNFNFNLLGRTIGLNQFFGHFEKRRVLKKIVGGDEGLPSSQQAEDDGASQS